MVLGKEHLSTWASMKNLEAVLRDQGKYAQAEEMPRHVLQLSGTVLDKENPSTLTSMRSAEGSGQVRAGGKDASTDATAEPEGARQGAS